MINRKQAALLYGHEYKLVDIEGNVCDIMAVHGNNFRVFYPSGHQFLDNVFCDFSQIGKEFFILCRPLSSLTKTIVHEGKEIVPMKSLSGYEGIFDFIHMGYSEKSYKSYYETGEGKAFFRIRGDINSNDGFIIDKLYELHFQPHDIPNELTKHMEDGK